MTCIVAENRPLTKLKNELKITFRCHSRRSDNCIHKLERLEGNYAMGVPGAALGYCQALFVKRTDPKTHTQNLIDLLGGINAPWHKSHELFWGNRTTESASDFINLSIEPLLGTGRMPILITPLNPNKDYDVINEILATAPMVYDGESTLIRIVLTDNDSVEKSALQMQNILIKARQSQTMPKFWMLLQGQLEYADWLHLKSLMGDDWQYINIAVNPFTIDGLPDFCWEQVTVAQVILGHYEGIDDDGTIELPEGMKISGAKECDGYNIFEYFNKLEKLEVSPTLIVLGPSLPDWTDEYNLKRIQKLLPLMRQSCNQLWRKLSQKNRELIWELTA